MNINKFDYYLPEFLIAQKPATPRDHARLLVVDKKSGELQDDVFFHLANLLQPNDVLVLNKTKVKQNRILFKKKDKILELFLINRLDSGFWKAMVKPGKYFKKGDNLDVYGNTIKVVDIDEDGFRLIDLGLNDRQVNELMLNHGKMPVPPYIKGNKFKEDEYNTVFSQSGASIAAPTAGLHFTNELLHKLREKGVKIEYVNLNVGLGTFLPVKVQDTRLHKMHTENYDMDYSTALRLNRYKQENRRIIAVGTTSVRVLEDNYSRFKEFRAGYFSTEIFINPGYNWKVVNGLITNFHLPKSTLLMLVSSFLGYEKTMKAYNYSVARGYQFFSFGDAMLII